MRNAYKNFVGKQWKNPLGRPSLEEKIILKSITGK
jgi:hypothetical protein